MAFLTHSEQTDKCFPDHTDQRVGCSVNRRNPPEMDRILSSSKNQRTAGIGKHLNQRFSHGRDELFWGRQKRVEYPARRHHEAHACPNRNATFHAGTPTVFLCDYLTNQRARDDRRQRLTGCTDSSSSPRAVPFLAESAAQSALDTPHPTLPTISDTC